MKTYVCIHCGYDCVSDEKPEVCPVCNDTRFEEAEQNESEQESV